MGERYGAQEIYIFVSKQTKINPRQGVCAPGRAGSASGYKCSCKWDKRLCVAIKQRNTADNVHSAAS